MIFSLSYMSECIVYARIQQEILFKAKGDLLIMSELQVYFNLVIVFNNKS